MNEKMISTGIIAKKEIEEADRCILPNLIKGICEKCRDVRYCYRQRTLFDEKTGEQYGWARVLDYIGVGWQPQETLF